MTDVDAAYAQFRKDIVEKVPGKVLFTKVWGSHSHGCATPESDVDFLAVYQWSLRDALRMTLPVDTVEGKGPDFQAHEIGKFCALLLKGNPAVVECLFTEKWYDAEPTFQRLIAMRKDFINAQTLKQYLGYGQSQLQRLRAGTRLHTKTGGKDPASLEKWCYHLFRMGWDAERISRGRAPLVRKEGEELKQLMAVRHGEWTPAIVEEQFRSIEAIIDRNKPWPIPEAADREKLDDWLYELRTSAEGF